MDAPAPASPEGRRAPRWAAIALSLGLSADFARMAAMQLPPGPDALLAWLSGGLAAASVLAALRGLRAQRGAAVAALVCAAIWIVLAVEAGRLAE
jgi:hypothetical protein